MTKASVPPAATTSFTTHCYCYCPVTSVMSDSVRPHRRQPTRLPRPWDSPGKTTGVGCHFLLQCMKVKNESEVAQLCLTLSDPMDCSLPGSSVHGIFQARVLEWGALPSPLPPTGTAFLCNISVSSTFHAHRHCVCLLSAPVLELLDTHSPLNTTRLPPGHQQGSDCGGSHTPFYCLVPYIPQTTARQVYMDVPRLLKGWRSYREFRGKM